MEGGVEGMEVGGDIGGGAGGHWEIGINGGIESVNVGMKRRG